MSILTPTTAPITNFENSFEPETEYRLSDVQLEIPDNRTAVICATTNGPTGSTVWVRAWISNEREGGLGEAELAEVAAGERVELRVILVRESIPELACVRIESERLATKHTMHVRLS